MNELTYSFSGIHDTSMYPMFLTQRFGSAHALKIQDTGAMRG